MQTFFICAIIAATALLFFVAHREKQYKKQAYIVAILVPVIGTFIYFTLILPRLHRQDVPTSLQEQREAFVKNLDEEQKEAESKLSSNPDDINAIIDLAGIQMQKTEYQQALNTVNNALVKHPGHKDLTIQLSMIHFSQGLFLGEQQKYPEALSSLKTAKQTAPKDAPFIKQLDIFIDMLEKKIAIDQQKNSKAQ